MKWQLRSANVNDAEELAALIRISLGDAVKVEYLKNVLQHSSRVTIVAESDGQILGFADAFMTLSSVGVPRWELDLLGVLPDARGMGLGRALIAACTAFGWQHGAHSARALIAVRNAASQAAFAAAHYQQDAALHHLFVCGKALGSVMGYLRASAAIPVRTLTYEGWWLEGDLVLDPRPTVPERRAFLGVVVPIENQERQKLLQELGFDCIGEYQWWKQPRPAFF